MSGSKQKIILLYMIPWAILLLGFALKILAGEHAEIVGTWFLLASVLIFGLPHGACDFWILQQTARDQKRSLSWLFFLLSIYLFLALATAAVWYFVPTLALVAFLALSAWHFGSGDAVWDNQSQNIWFLNSMGRGLLVMAAPITFYQKASGLVLSTLTGSGGAQIVEILLQLAPILLLIGIIFLLMGSWQKSASLFFFENAFLLIFFWLTTPLLAVTCYLIGVHSWRHLLRLNLYEKLEKPFLLSNVWLLVGSYHQRALPFTLLSLIGSAGIMLFWQIRLANLLEWTSAYLVLLSALTVPHAILISWTELQRTSNFAASAKSADLM